ncbi:MAG TPA: isoprenylcysteine carboxylmethyltransferase family protein [Stellaceae bacterium]|nr:isoprenylcysteine carboxylmethyltransferase family protein [Stellaceae bacterium]
MNEAALAAAGAVGALKLAELWHARRNAAALLAAGGVELGRGHYPLIVALHAAWLLAIATLVPKSAEVSWPLLGLFAGLQLLRLWILASLGRYWTTRVITVPGAPLVRKGPYRFLKHPNYLVVAAEIAVLPLAFGAWEISIVFSMLNAAILSWRLKIENDALAQRASYSQVMGS